MDTGVIAVRYAKALLESAIRLKLEDAIYEEMQTLSTNYIQVPKLRFTIDNPTLGNEKKLALLKTACGGDINDLTVRFLNLVFKEGRESSLAVYGNGLFDIIPETQKHHSWKVDNRRTGFGRDGSQDEANGGKKNSR